jgi:hypothetical protein
MIELKTLNDLKLCDWHIDDISAKNTLRREAIKVVKYEPKSELGDLWDLTEWIKFFFNLTEEDLKENSK